MFKRFRKPPYYFQFFASIHWTTCEVCLKLHGEIFEELHDGNSPPIHENCRCHLLRFPKKELKSRRESSKNMAKIATNELTRRGLLQKGIELIGSDNEQAFDYLKQAIYQEVYLGDIERLLDEKGDQLKLDPEWAHSLMKFILKIHKFKYDKPKYGHMPPAMQQARVSYGESLIKELFSALIPGIKGRIG